MLGNAIKTPTVNTSATKNGAQPLNTSCTGISGLTPLTTKQLSPMGGVIKHSSAILTTMIPNQIGSYPSAITAGWTTGSVSNNIP